jgi:hypothetical protein
MGIIEIFRLEFLQPDGRWTGPYCAEYMTAGAFAIRDRMAAYHKNSDYHAFPDAQVFANNPGKDRYVCGVDSMEKLQEWFGEYFVPFLAEGGHIGVYGVPEEAIVENDGRQIVYQQRRGQLISREGTYTTPGHLLLERIHPDKLAK